MAEVNAPASVESSIFTSVINEIIYSPLNVALIAAIVILSYKIFKSRRQEDRPIQKEPELPKLKKQDMYIEELRKYDGTPSANGRILIAVNCKIFDVTRGKRFYGPGGPYAAFAGRDASRALATFTVDCVKDDYDDLSDLNTMQMDSVREWEMQITEKYEFIGRLLKPGEEAGSYSDEEEETNTSESKPKDE